MESKPTTELVIRKAEEEDVPLILSLIMELARYEHLEHEVTATRAKLEESLFGAKPLAEALIAEYESEPAGFAVYFHTFSTFLAGAGIYLEDLYVRPGFRGQGIGRALLVYVAKLATERHCGRVEWAVLGWNESAVGFYENLDAIALDEWRLFRLSGSSLQKLARES